MKTIFVLPISGVDLVRYISIFYVLSSCGLRPDLVFSASGGTIASYTAMMSSFSETVKNWTFNSEMFVRKSTIFTPRLLTYSMRGFFYRRPNIESFIRQEFAFQKIQDIEIISGYFETEEKKNQITIATNFPKSKSFIKDNMVANISGVVYVSYANEKNNQNNVDYLKKVLDHSIDIIIKTSNIPVIAEPIGESKAIDFGFIAPSPLDFVKSIDGKFIYFSPIDLEDNTECSLYSAYFRNLIISDIARIKKKFTHEKKIANVHEFEMFVKNNNCNAVIYNRCPVHLNIDNFTNKEYKDFLNCCISSVNFLVFY